MRVLNVVRRDVEIVGQYLRGTVSKKILVSPEEGPSLEAIRRDQEQEELR